MISIEQQKGITRNKLKGRTYWNASLGKKARVTQEDLNVYVMVNKKGPKEPKG